MGREVNLAPGHRRRDWRGHWPIVAILALAAVLVLTNLGRDYLWSDEGDTAILAESILQSGVPKAWDGVSLVDSDYGARLNDRLVMVSHPWLQYYLVAAAFAALGESPFAARLPFALLGLLTIALTYVLVLRATQHRWTAASAALLLMCSVQFLLYARQSRNYTLNAALTCLLVLQFLRLRSWPSALGFAAIAVLLFHSHPVAVAPIAALGVLTLAYRPCRPIAPWFWRAMLLAAPLMLPWFAIASDGYREATGLLPSLDRLPSRFAQYLVEVASVTSVVGGVVLALVVVRRRRDPAAAGPARRAAAAATSGAAVFTRTERTLFAIAMAFVASYGLLMALTQPRDVIFSSGLRYTPAVLPLMAMTLAMLVAKVSGGRRVVWIALLVVFAFTKIGRITPWTFWQSPTALRDPQALVTFHNPTQWIDRLLRTGQAAFVRSLVTPTTGTTGRIVEFLKARAAPNDIVITNYGWEPLYFHTDLRQGLTVLPTYPIYQAAREQQLPDYVFTANGARWIVWRQAWGAYRGHRLDGLLRELAAAKVPVERVATIPETLWENRENIHYRRFAGNRYIYPWYGTLPPTIVYRVDWERAGQGGE